LRFSVVIPTYERRDIVVRTVSAFDRQVRGDFEVIAVVDGSTDGTADALRRLSVRFPLKVLEQANQGASVARNAGAAAAAGELLVFLDDDMEAHPKMLAEHDRSHLKGADVVLGHLPLHPGSPPTVLTPGVARWTERRRRRLATCGTDIPLSDLLSGQMSIARVEFERLGGFDVTFTRHGLFGGEDIDFGYRARKAGLSIVFNESAVSFQYYDVDPAVYTRRSREAGRAAQELSVKHPERANELGRVAPRFATRRTGVILGALGIAPAALSRPLRTLAVRLVKRANPGPTSRRLFFEVQTMERLRGARQAWRALHRPQAVVLAYHALSDLRGDPLISEYGVSGERFAEHLDMLAGRGCHFVSLDALLRALAGEGDLPARSVLVTFDDAYADFLTQGYPVLAARRIPAVVFAVTDRIGGTNDWDQRVGARQLPLLDADGLLTIASGGIAVGSHGATHRPVAALSQSELEAELQGSAARLASLGLPRPTVFSYPHGQWSAEAAAALEAAGYVAGFTVSAGVARRAANRYAVPRIEVYASDTPRTLWLKLLSAPWPEQRRRRLLRVLQASTDPPWTRAS
jgi:peptidoglycan/xylan/chitin deacetylase (PgdA/CDA1 family)/GT2 family glycosyltransferase